MFRKTIFRTFSSLLKILAGNLNYLLERYLSLGGDLRLRGDLLGGDRLDLDLSFDRLLRRGGGLDLDECLRFKESGEREREERDPLSFFAFLESRESLESFRFLDFFSRLLDRELKIEKLNY